MNKKTFSKAITWVITLALTLAIIPAVPMTVWAVDKTWWDSETPPTANDGETVTIEAGASGTLAIPANSTVTIDGYREAEYYPDGQTRIVTYVDNGDKEITLNIPATSKVIWRAGYKGSVINVTGGGSLEITSGFLNDDPIPKILVNAEISVSGGSAVLIDGSAARVTGNLSPDDTAVIVELTGTDSYLSKIDQKYHIGYGRNDRINVTPADVIAVWTRSGDKHGIGYVRDTTTGFIPVTWASVEDASHDNIITVNAITNEFAVAAAHTAVAIAPPDLPAVVEFTNASTISQTALASMMTIAQNADVDLEIHADSLDENGAVFARMYLPSTYINAAAEGKLSVNEADVGNPSGNTTGNINLSVSRAENTRFIAENYAASIILAQQGTFGGELRVAVKVALPRDPSALKFYTYSPTSNSYKVITPPNFIIDDRGYPYMFSKGLAGDILISPDDFPGNDVPQPRTRAVVNDDWYVHFYVESGGEYVITDEEPIAEVRGVTVSPSTVDVQIGTTQQFDVEVATTNSLAPTVIWEVTGNDSSDTTINSSGLLSVADDEDSDILTVTATSTFDTTKFGTATVTVTQPKPPNTDPTTPQDTNPTPPVEYIGDETIIEALETENPVIDLSETNNTIITAEMLQAIAASGKDVTVILESGFEFTILADSISPNAIAIDLNFDIYLTSHAENIDGVKIPENSIIITPNFSGEFGFEIKFNFTSEQLEEAGIDADNVKLFHVDHDGKVTDMGKVKLNADGSVEFIISHASYYVLAEEAPEGMETIPAGNERTASDETNPHTAVTISLGATFAFTAAMLAGGAVFFTHKTKKRREKSTD